MIKPDDPRVKAALDEQAQWRITSVDGGWLVMRGEVAYGGPIPDITSLWAAGELIMAAILTAAGLPERPLGDNHD